LSQKSPIIPKKKELPISTEKQEKPVTIERNERPIDNNVKSVSKGITFKGFDNDDKDYEQF
jgi:hypothetical protein